MRLSQQFPGAEVGEAQLFGRQLLTFAETRLSGSRASGPVRPHTNRCGVSSCLQKLQFQNLKMLFKPPQSTHLPAIVDIPTNKLRDPQVKDLYNDELGLLQGARYKTGRYR